MKYNVGDYLLCTKTLYNYNGKTAFLKDHKYEIIYIFGPFQDCLRLLSEEESGHDITGGNRGWLKYFKTEKELRDKKLKRIINEK